MSVDVFVTCFQKFGSLYPVVNVAKINWLLIRYILWKNCCFLIVFFFKQINCYFFVARESHYFTVTACEMWGLNFFITVNCFFFIVSVGLFKSNQPPEALCAVQ